MTHEEAHSIFYSGFDKMSHGKHFKEVFFEWIEWALNIFKGKFNLQNLPTNRKYYEMFKAFGVLSEDFTDALGDIYMNKISNGANEQYFTPKHACELMVDVSKIEYQNTDTIVDIACGSGRLLLAGIKHARTQNKEVSVKGCDIDILCCKMTLLNMLIQSVEGEILHSDSITGKVWKVFEIKRGSFYGNIISFWNERDF